MSNWENYGRYRLANADCLEAMAGIPANTVDMVLTDPPYGTTACKWDAVIPFEPMWEQLKRITKKNAAIVMTASQPFTSALVVSNLDMFKYCWYWEKSRPTGFTNAKKQPLRCVEEVLVFYGKPSTYNPQDRVRVDKVCKNSTSCGGDTMRQDVGLSVGKGQLRTPGSEYVQEFTNYPRQLLRLQHDTKTVHPTQKPVGLMEYLIKTYTNENDIVLDFTMGSGTTGVACMNLNRRFIGIEKDATYYELAKNRIAESVQKRKENAST